MTLTKNRSLIGGLAEGHDGLRRRQEKQIATGARQKPDRAIGLALVAFEAEGEGTVWRP